MTIFIFVQLARQLYISIGQECYFNICLPAIIAAKSENLPKVVIPVVARTLLT
jgi:hypothetical protein